ncbi:MAG TPA: NAD-dependent epimerase/dehydratase family protein, partial [Bacteroidia bacterium]|nr:NAD-dependent epimerase/dehydratase family protein [Bacteroidia bacterium]
METVLITGASGLIGSSLTPLLKKRGYRVTHLSRSIPENAMVETFIWDVRNQTIDIQAIEEADYIIHLAGAGIADKKWTTSRKKEIIDSRVESTHLIFKTLQKANKRLKGFVSASAIGIYGAVTSEKIFSETDTPATDFLGVTCKLWEGAAETIAKLD